MRLVLSTTHVSESDLRERSARERLITTVSVVALIVGLGWIDYVTGPDFGFSLFYILPISVVAWRYGRTEAWSAAIAAGIAWFVAEEPWRIEALWWALVWDGFTRFVIYTFIATSVSAMRRDKRTIDAANRKLKELLEETERLARTDSLTGLANTRAFDEHLKQEASRARRSGKSICLAYIDLDNFKRVNDLYGHTRGDEVLSDVAQAIKSAVRKTDFVARLGGDEFATILIEADPMHAKELGMRIVDRVTSLNEGLVNVGLGASVGIVHLATPPEDLDQIITLADAAMYVAKAAGKGRVEVQTRLGV